MRTRHCIRAVSTVLSTFLLVACASGVRVSTLEVDDARLHQRTSFAWVDRGSTGLERDAALAAEVNASVRQVAVSELRRKGYEEVSPEQADLLVSYQVIVTDAGPLNRGEPTSGMSPQGSVGPGDPFRELRDRGTLTPDVRQSHGSLLVFVTDSRSGRILWRGTAESLMTSRREGARKVPSAVRQMFEKFPAREVIRDQRSEPNRPAPSSG